MVVINKLGYQKIKKWSAHYANYWRKKWSIKANEASLTTTTHTRKIYILPTLKGLGFIVVMIVMFLWSTNHELSLGYVFMFFCICFFLISAVLAVANLVHLKIICQQADQCFAKQLAYYPIIVENLKSQIAIDIRLSHISQQKDLIKLPITELATLKALDKRQFNVAFQHNQRGVFPTGLIKIQSEYPIKLFTVWTWLEFPCQQIVYPAIKGELPFPDQKNSNSNSPNQNALHDTGSDDFDTLKDYQQGDDFRRVYWRKSTYQNHWVVKQFSSSANSHYIFDLEDRVLNHLSLEDKLSQLCVWVIQAHELNIKYALKLPNQLIALNKGKAHKYNCLRALACF